MLNVESTTLFGRECWTALDGRCWGKLITYTLLTLITLHYALGYSGEPATIIFDYNLENKFHSFGLSVLDFLLNFFSMFM